MRPNSDSGSAELSESKLGSICTYVCTSYTITKIVLKNMLLYCANNTIFDVRVFSKKLWKGITFLSF